MACNSRFAFNARRETLLNLRARSLRRDVAARAVWNRGSAPKRRRRGARHRRHGFGGNREATSRLRKSSVNFLPDDTTEIVEQQRIYHLLQCPNSVIERLQLCTDGVQLSIHRSMLPVPPHWPARLRSGRLGGGGRSHAAACCHARRSHGTRGRVREHTKTKATRANA